MSLSMQPHGSEADGGLYDGIFARGTYRCQHCPEVFPMRYQLVAHMATHSKWDPPVKKEVDEEEPALATCRVKEEPVEEPEEEQEIRVRYRVHMNSSQEKGPGGTQKLRAFRLQRKPSTGRGMKQKKELAVLLHRLLSCPQCNDPFVTQEDLEHHKKIVHSKKKELAVLLHRLLSCPQCKDPFVTQEDLEHHKKMMHPKEAVVSRSGHQKTHACPTCGKHLPTPSRLKHHLVIHTGEKPYKCHFCPMAFNNSGTRLRHMRSAHPGRSVPVSCTRCNGIFKNLVLLKAHMKACRLAKLFKCKNCSRTFRTLGEVKVHMVVHTDKRLFSCSLCSKKFKTRVLLEHHAVCHSDVRPFRCEHCPQAFKKRRYLQLHLNRIHLEAEYVTCDVCGKKMKSMYISDHKRLHVRGKRYSCKMCPKSFYSPSNLGNHIRVQHEGVKSYVCDVCNKPYTTFYIMKHHKEERHGLGGRTSTRAYKRKKYLCHVCDKLVFDLKSHLATHTGEKPFQCNFCPSAFAQKSGLTSHITSRHTTERPLVCNLCGKRFKRKCILQTHIRETHFGIKRKKSGNAK